MRRVLCEGVFNLLLQFVKIRLATGIKLGGVVWVHSDGEVALRGTLLDDTLVVRDVCERHARQHDLAHTSIFGTVKSVDEIRLVVLLIITVYALELFRSCRDSDLNSSQSTDLYFRGIKLTSAKRISADGAAGAAVGKELRSMVVDMVMRILNEEMGRVSKEEKCGFKAQ